MHDWHTAIFTRMGDPTNPTPPLRRMSEMEARASTAHDHRKVDETHENDQLREIRGSCYDIGVGAGGLRL